MRLSASSENCFKQLNVNLFAQEHELPSGISGVVIKCRGLLEYFIILIWNNISDSKLGFNLYCQWDKNLYEGAGLINDRKLEIKNNNNKSIYIFS